MSVKRRVSSNRSKPPTTKVSIRHRWKPNRQLRFSPYAWAKLLYLRDVGSTEIGGFGICDQDDLLLVTDFVLVRQRCTEVSVEFDDNAVADFFDDQVSFGRRPEQFARIWIHTHPGCSALPSSIDETTFQRCFGKPDWAVMFILAKGGQAYARFRSNAGPGMERRLEVDVDFETSFPASCKEAWYEQYRELVTVHDPFAGRKRSELAPLLTAGGRRR